MNYRENERKGKSLPEGNHFIDGSHKYIRKGMFSYFDQNFGCRCNLLHYVYFIFLIFMLMLQTDVYSNIVSTEIFRLMVLF